jgi:hypothetical protein
MNTGVRIQLLENYKIRITTKPIDLVLIDQQIMGKGSHLMDTVNEKEMDDHLLACQQF